MNKSEYKILNKIMDRKGVESAYLFGSRVHGKITHFSDYDFGIFFDVHIPKRSQEKIRKEIFLELSRLYQTDEIHFININGISDPALRYNIIILGRCMYAKDFTKKLIMEIKTRKEYEDTKYLRQTGLYLQNQRIRSGAFGTRYNAMNNK
ncbi:MAG: polymerase beta domain protein region protein [Parcubacteria group bacterium GW2011_GWA2_38_13]|nr:MAG: polymerase beta domain protein region protein [Parcubacteria group bacterium GW2011_GWA2_38_13]